MGDSIINEAISESEGHVTHDHSHSHSEDLHEPERKPGLMESSKLFAVIIGAILSSLVAVNTWELKTIVDISDRVAHIEANASTKNDTLEVWKQIADIRLGIANMPRDAAPKWFVERVDRLESKIDTNLANLDTRVTTEEQLLHDHLLADKLARENAAIKRGNKPVDNQN